MTGDIPPRRRESALRIARVIVADESATAEDARAALLGMLEAFDPEATS